MHQAAGNIRLVPSSRSIADKRRMLPGAIDILYSEVSGRFSLEFNLDEGECQKFVAWSPPFQLRENISVDRVEREKRYIRLRSTTTVLPGIRFAVMDPRQYLCLGFIRSKMKGVVFLWGDTVALEDKAQETIAAFRAPPLFQQLKALIPGVPMSFPLIAGAMTVGVLEIRKWFATCRGVFRFDGSLPPALDPRILLGGVMLLAKRLKEGGA